VIALACRFKIGGRRRKCTKQHYINTSTLRRKESTTLDDFIKIVSYFEHYKRAPYEEAIIIETSTSIINKYIIEQELEGTWSVTDTENIPSKIAKFVKKLIHPDIRTDSNAVASAQEATITKMHPAFTPAPAEQAQPDTDAAAPVEPLLSAGQNGKSENVADAAPLPDNIRLATWRAAVSEYKKTTLQEAMTDCLNGWICFLDNLKAPNILCLMKIIPD
jgi:hypothetical protein